MNMKSDVADAPWLVHPEFEPCGQTGDRRGLGNGHRHRRYDALHCDQVYAARGARFSMPFAKLGLCPEFASSLLLPQVSATSAPRNCSSSASRLPPNEAFDAGLVQQVLPAAELMSYADGRARRTCRPAARVPARHQAASQSAAPRRGDRADRPGKPAFQRHAAGAGGQEAFAAFCEHRKPDYSKIFD